MDNLDAAIDEFSRDLRLFYKSGNIPPEKAHDHYMAVKQKFVASLLKIVEDNLTPAVANRIREAGAKSERENIYSILRNLPSTMYFVHQKLHPYGVNTLSRYMEHEAYLAVIDRIKNIGLNPNFPAKPN